MGPAIRPFQVATDVKVGEILPSQTSNVALGHWSLVSKNKDSTDPTKTQGDPRRNRHNGNDRGDGDASSLESASNIPLADGARERNIVFSDFTKENMLAKAVHVAFYKHYPLRLSPDVIWLTIVQGLAKHIDKDPEAQRENFVNFDGKKTLTVSRPGFVKGSPKNDWTTVFPEFANKVASYIGSDKMSTLSCNFSTSSPTEAICSNISLMDTVKHYFNYEMLCGCGIPSIELAGTPADWDLLREKANVLQDFGLDWWTEELYPVLDQFVSAAQGSPDVKFWKSVCNLNGGSGFWMDYVTGWVQVFFPYLNSGERSRALGQWRENYETGTGEESRLYNEGKMPSGFHVPGGYGVKLNTIPSGLSQAPFVYRDLSDGTDYDMTFNGGLVAVLQDKATRALEPVTGWAVLDHGVSK